MMMTPDVNVFVIDFKDTNRREIVSLNEDDSYSIFINARLSNEEQLKAYNHAIKHITENDFEKQNVQEIEATAHEIIKPASAQPEPAIPQQATSVIQKPKRRKRRQRKPIDRYQVYDRAEFLAEHFDVFALAEHQYLYGKDL